MSDTKISWADKVWNPIVGCSKCSPGCLNCYAERMAGRLWHIQKEDGGPYKDLGCYDGKWSGKVITIPSVLDQPLHWRKPCRIFVCSMSDIFGPKVPFGFIDRIFDIIDGCKQHTYLILTKRVKRMCEYFASYNYSNSGIRNRYLSFNKNIHIGVSISNQAEADEKIPILLQIPAAVRWLSVEPMLGEISVIKLLDNRFCKERLPHYAFIDGVIVGCESGPKRRPCKLEWVQSIVDQCEAAGVACFVKQISIDGKVVKMPKGFPQEYPK